MSDNILKVEPSHSFNEDDGESKTLKSSQVDTKSVMLSKAEKAKTTWITNFKEGVV